MELRKVRAADVRVPPFFLRRMDDEEFAALVRSIDEVGYVEPIQVVEDCGGGYRLVNGYHRLKALTEVFGRDEVEAVVVGRMCCGEGGGDCWDDLRYMVEVVRLNNIRGRWVWPALLEHVRALLREAERRGVSRDKVLYSLGDPRAIVRRMERGKRPADPVLSSLVEACKETAKASLRGEGKHFVVVSYADRSFLLVRVGSAGELAEVSSILDALGARGYGLLDVLRAAARFLGSGGKDEPGRG